MVKLLKTKGKEKILNTSREKKSLFSKEEQLSPKAELSRETMECRRKWNSIFKVLKERKISLDFQFQEEYPSDTNIRILLDTQKI